jgi:hypothetical protein
MLTLRVTSFLPLDVRTGTEGVSSVADQQAIRRAQIVGILAAGLLRLLKSQKHSELPAEIPSSTCLEVPGDVRLSVPVG